MDLGTICKHLERGSKYRSSQDVYEDIQLVWTNCRIYNQKGDPILDLLARVKKNFMKYWTAAGLYTEKPSGWLDRRFCKLLCLIDKLYELKIGRILRPLCEIFDAFHVVTI